MDDEGLINRAIALQDEAYKVECGCYGKSLGRIFEAIVLFVNIDKLIFTKSYSPNTMPNV